MRMLMAKPFIVITVFALLSVSPAMATMITYNYTADFDRVILYESPGETATATLTISVDNESVAGSTWYSPAPQASYSSVTGAVTITGSDSHDGVYTQEIGAVATGHGSYPGIELEDTVSLNIRFNIDSLKYRFYTRLELENGIYPAEPEFAKPVMFDQDQFISVQFARVFRGEHDLPETDPFDVDWDGNASASAVPEPATMLLLGTGLVGLVGFRRKFKA